MGITAVQWCPVEVALCLVFPDPGDGESTRVFPAVTIQKAVEERLY